MNYTTIHYWFNFYSTRSMLEEIDARQYLELEKKKDLKLALYIVVFPITAIRHIPVKLSPFDLPKFIYIGNLN